MKDLINTSADVATGGEPVTGLISTILEKGMTYYENKRSERFKSFYEKLYQGTTEEEQLEYEKQIEARLEDFYGLLNAAIEDEEKEKVEIYVNLFKAIRDKHNNFKGKNTKYQAIKIAKDLPFSALEIMKNTFIEGSRNKYKKPVQGVPAFNIAVENYLARIDTVSLRFEINLLEQYTVLYRNPKSSKLKLNPFAVTLVKSYYSDKELTV